MPEITALRSVEHGEGFTKIFKSQQQQYKPRFCSYRKSTDEFSVKKDVEKFLRRIQLKAFFHDKEDNSNASDKDIFETLHVRKSKWTPPEGQFASLDFFIKKCRHDIQKLKFNCHTKFSNLSSEEWLALKNLSKRHDMTFERMLYAVRC